MFYALENTSCSILNLMDENRTVYTLAHTGTTELSVNNLAFIELIEIIENMKLTVPNGSVEDTTHRVTALLKIMM